MANMIHPLTGSDYISEQAFNAVVDKAKAEIDTKISTAITTADIPGAVDAAIALLPLPAVTVGATVPAAPVNGHIWVDTTSGEVVKLYTGTAWVILTSTPVGG